VRGASGALSAGHHRLLQRHDDPVSHHRLEKVLPGNNRPRTDLSLSEPLCHGENEASDEQQKH
jgi:hypothetical protein